MVLLGVVMWRIDRSNGNIYNENNKSLFSTCNISKTHPSHFFYPGDNGPFLESGGWLANLEEQDIEYLLSYWENFNYIVSSEHFKKLKQNYKKYKIEILIKDIIE